MKELYDFDETLRKEAQTFARQVMEPSRAHSDREGCRMENGSVRVCASLKASYLDAYRLGYASPGSDPAYGGAGLSFSECLTIKEEIAAANMGLFMFFVLTEGAARLIDAFGCDTQKEEFLEKMIRGEYAGTMCITEPQAGSDLGLIEASAVETGTGIFRIKGTKQFISGGDHDLAQNIIHLVLARAEGDPPGLPGLSVFVVPARVRGADGGLTRNDVSVSSLERKMGIHSSPTTTLIFGENDACTGTLLGKRRDGMRTMFHLINESRLNVGAIALSVAAAATSYAEQYARERTQGIRICDRGKPDAQRVPIAYHGNIAGRLLRMKAQVFALRALNRRAASLLDSAGDNNDAGVIAGLMVPVVKGFSSEIALNITRDAIDVLGGAGYTQDHPVEQFYRDLRVTTIYEGTTDIQAIDLIFRKLWHREAKSRLMGYLESCAARCGGTHETSSLLPLWEQSIARVFSALDYVQKIAESPDATLFSTRLFMSLSSSIAAILMLEDTSRARSTRPRHYPEALQLTHFYIRTLLPETDSFLAAIEHHDDPLQMYSAQPLGTEQI